MITRLFDTIIGSFKAAGIVRFVVVYFVLELILMNLFMNLLPLIWAVVFTTGSKAYLKITDDFASVLSHNWIHLNNLQDLVYQNMVYSYILIFFRVFSMQVMVQAILLISFRLQKKQHQLSTYLLPVMVSLSLYLVPYSLAMIYQIGDLKGIWEAFVANNSISYLIRDAGVFIPGFYMILSAGLCWWVMQWLYRKSFLQD